MADSDALTRLADWLDDRIGYRAARALLHDRLLEGGPHWSYATGVCSLGLFLLVGFTGLLLMTSYSPASDHGWSSVFLIEATPGGSFVRGLHYYGSHVLLIVFAIHMARAILNASFRAPRELAWISGLLLFLLLIGAAVTGNPLSASNKALAQIEVESHIVGNMPLIGRVARVVFVGGEDVGHLTITRLYALHVAILPMLAGFLLLFHLAQHLRWGTIKPSAATTDAPPAESLPGVARETRPAYWPNQTARNALVFGVAFGAVAFLAWRYGAPLDAPADPTLVEMPRPEWYFRALFELRSYFSGAADFIATGLLPVLFLAFLALLPWIDRLLPRSVSTVFRYAVVVLAATGWITLTAASFARDRKDEAFQAYLVEASERAERARLLASVQRVPPEGPAALLQRDPMTQGPRLFRRHCANCHSHVDKQGHGITAATPAASNLYGFPNRDWIAGLLNPERIAGSDYYGHTEFVTGGSSMGMIDFVRDELYAVDEAELPARKEQVAKVVAALSAEAALPAQAELDKHDAALIAEGRELLVGDELGCINCHKFGDTGDLGLAPDLTDYGSRNWLAAFTADPTHERFYDGNNDGMPAFMPAEPGSPENILSRDELLMIVDWLRGDWIRP